MTAGRPDRPLAGAAPVLWCDGAHDATENMRRDAALLARLEAASDGHPAVIRLYRFAPPGITLGRAQRPEQELDLDRCREEGVAWAVRPTGGRAIFHDQEWTFSLAARLADPAWGGSLAEAYAAASGLVHAALAALGVPAERVARRITRPAAATAPAAAAACFAAAARHEIVLGPGKLAGIAQRRGRSALLQQGSVLLGPGHLRLADLLALPEERRAAAREALAAAAADAGPWLAGASLERFAGAIAAALGGPVRRWDAAAGGFLLTLEKPPSYTRAVSQGHHGQGLAGESTPCV